MFQRYFLMYCLLPMGVNVFLHLDDSTPSQHKAVSFTQLAFCTLRYQGTYMQLKCQADTSIISILKFLNYFLKMAPETFILVNSINDEKFCYLNLSFYFLLSMAYWI